MAAVVFADGESWVVSGQAFRMLITAMRQLVNPRDVEFLGSLDGYEAVKGMTLALLDEKEQLRVAELIISGTAKLIDDLVANRESPKTAELHERLLQLQALARQHYPAEREDGRQ